MSTSQHSDPTRRPDHIAEAWDAYRASQPEEWEMLADHVGDAYHRRRAL